MKYLLSLLVAFYALPVHAMDGPPLSPEVIFSVEHLGRNEIAEMRDRNGVLRNTVTILEEEHGCKYYRVQNHDHRWKSCRDGSNWRFYDATGNSKLVEVDAIRVDKSGCRGYKFRTRTSRVYHGTAIGCQTSQMRWGLRE